MTRYFFILYGIISIGLPWGLSQSQLEKKIQQAKQILQAIDISKPSQAPLEKQLEQIIREAQTLNVMINPPFIPKHWELKGYQKAWKVNYKGISLVYSPSYSLVKPGIWTNEPLAMSAIQQLCQENNTKPESIGVSGGNAVKVSQEGRKVLCQWMLQRKLTSAEENLLKTNDAVVVISEPRKNIFHAIEGQNLSVQTWEGWDDENTALQEAIAFWQAQTKLGATEQELKQINQWIALLQGHNKLLVQEKEMFAKLEAAKEQIESPKKILADDMKTLKDAVALCTQYTEQANQGKMSKHYLKNVGSWQQSWNNKSNVLGNLAKQEKEVLELEDSLAQKKDAEELKQGLQKTSEAIKEYSENVEKNRLEMYQNSRIVELESKIKDRLVQAIFSTKIDALRKVYQDWQTQRNKTTANDEGKVIAQVETAYEDYVKTTKSTTEESPYEETVQNWWKEIEERKQALAQEESLSSEIQGTFGSINEKMALKDQLGKLEKVSELCEKYRQLSAKREVSTYQQRELLEIAQKVTDTKKLVSKEIELFTELEKAHKAHQSASYKDWAEENKAVLHMMKLATEYENGVTYKQIQGIHQTEVKQWKEKIQARNERLVEENNLFNLIDSNAQKWKDTTNWAKLSAEETSINKIVEYCQNYNEQLQKKAISNYYQGKVKYWQGQVEQQKLKLQKEEELFSALESSQKAYTETKFTQRQQEEDKIQELQTLCKKYQDALKNSQIAGHNKARVDKWTEDCQAKRQRLSKEEELYSEIAKQYKALKESYGSAQQEKQALDDLIAKIKNYQQKLINLESSNYHQSQVSEYLSQLNERQRKIDTEMELFANINKKQQAVSNAKYDSLSKELEDLEALSVLYQNYQKDTRISSYHKQDIVQQAATLDAKMKKLQQVSGALQNLSATYDNWKGARSWTSFVVEEKEVLKIFTFADEYKQAIKKTGVTDYHAKEIATWLQDASEQKKRLDGEKDIFEKIKDQRKILDEKTFSGIEEEKKFIDGILQLGAEHLEKSKKKEITNHNQRTIIRWERRLRAQMTKLEKEENNFKQIELAYNFWKNTQTWPSKDKEQGAIEKALQRVASYTEESQLRRTTDYNKEKVKTYEKELKERQVALRSK